MDGVHDMGGRHGMGPIVREEDEPVFHAPWEARAFGVTMAAGALGGWKLDTARRARERLPPAQYLKSSYYEIWLAALEALLVETGILSEAEIAARLAQLAGEGEPPAPVPAGEFDARALRADKVAAVLARGRKARSDDVVKARFAAGDRVAARVAHPAGHNRVPRYIRGRRGIIEVDHGVFVFPDSRAHGQGDKPQHVYGVRFAADELWGADAAKGGGSVNIDRWDDYLEPARAAGTLRSCRPRSRCRRPPPRASLAGRRRPCARSSVG